MNAAPDFIRRIRPLLISLLAAGFAAYALQNTIAQRHEVRKLTKALQQLQFKNRVLLDERRSLFLEYITLTDYHRLRTAAASLGLREPRLQDGSLMFLARKKKP